MSEEKKKPAVRHESVVANTFDELAQRLQDARNRLIEEGYDTTIEPVHEYLDPMFGYMIHATLVETVPQPQMAAIPITREQLAEMMNRRRRDEGDAYTPKTQSFVESVFSKFSQQDHEIAIKEIPKVVPMLLSNMPLSDINEIAAEIEKDVKDVGGEEHTAHCPTHRVLASIAVSIRENAKLNLQ